jgi:predicted DNA-binding transcriptional regulator YafY
VIQDAIVGRRVVRLTYVDREGALTEREVEPVLFATVRGRCGDAAGRDGPGDRAGPVAD